VLRSSVAKAEFIAICVRPEGLTLQKEELPIVSSTHEGGPPVQAFFQSQVLAHVTHVIGSVHLDLKSVWIIELEGFF